MSESLLPNNATFFERNLASATARLSDVPVPIEDVWDPATCPPGLLPWLAWAFSVDEWSPEWDVDQKRATIAQSVEVHRHKGTVGAVRTALAAVGIEVALQEWFNQTPTGAPHTFRLLINAEQYPVDQAALNKLLQVVGSSKNLRSHISEIVPGAINKSQVFIAGVSQVGTEITVAFDG